MKKNFLFILLILLLLVIFLGMFFLKPLFKKKLSGILVESEPVSEVYINGSLIGKTPFESNLKPEEILLEVVPVGTNITSFKTKIKLEPGVKTIVKRIFDINQENESGVIVSFEKINRNISQMAVVTAPDFAQIALNGRVVGYAPNLVKVEPGDYELLISNQGYLDKKLPIRVYKGYKLTAYIKLAKENVLEKSESEEVNERIEILDTDTGFLRVRKEPKLDSEVLGQVKPGEVYDILEKVKDSWYKIKVTLDVYDGESREIEGWVSGEFVKKID